MSAFSNYYDNNGLIMVRIYKDKNNQGIQVLV